MGHHIKTRHISAAPDQVFRAFTDPALLADWMEADAIVDQHGPLEAVGSSYTLVIKGPWRFHVRVTESAPPRRYAFAGVGPLGTTFGMQATLRGEGDTTELAVDTEWTLPLGGIGRWIDRRWVEPASAGEDDRELDRLVDIVTGHEERSSRAVVRAARRAREREREAHPGTSPGA